MITHLKRGQCLVRQALSSFPDTMLVTVDYVPPHRGASPQPDTHPYVAARTLNEMPELQQALAAKTAQFLGAKKEKAGGHSKGLSQAANEFRNLMSVHRFWPFSKLWGRMTKKLGPAKRQAIIEELLSSDLIAAEPTRLKKTTVMLGELTDKAYESMGLERPNHFGRGSLIHRHFAAWLQGVGVLRGCEKSMTEWVIPGTGHPVDVMWLCKNEYRIWEVVVDCSSNLVASLRSALDTSEITVAAVTVIAATKDRLQELKDIVRANDAEMFRDGRLHYETVSPYLKEFIDHESR